ncbi:MAG TPA: GNAT family N-acetyltransferase [Actinomycetota bacterium]|nr:GNAT family N-acetyltransferase [Actinomycetota bacterium]
MTFITRGTRHDKADREEFFSNSDWSDAILDKGVAFIARDGRVVGNVTLIEVEPNVLVVEDVLVADTHREQGIGRGLMQAAMNSRGGTLYLCCHPERLTFYSYFGFAEVPFEDLPDTVQAFMRDTNAAPDQLEPGHVHHYLKAR